MVGRPGNAFGRGEAASDTQLSVGRYTVRAMPIPDDVTHFVISGSNPGGEAFAFGYWIGIRSGLPVGGLDSQALWSTFRTELLNHMGPDQVITDYDTYAYSGGALVEHDHESVNHPGVDTTGALPLQVACVLTMRSDVLTRSGRGRLYLPTSGFSIMGGSGHLFASSVVNSLVDKFAAWLSTYSATGADPVVVSRTHGVMHTITSVDADLVPDTQRRRRNKLTSARHSAPVSGE